MKTYTMPDPGEGLTEAEVVSWLVSPGDTVKINDVFGGAAWMASFGITPSR